MYYRDVRVGGLYECTDILGIHIRDWHRNQPTPSELKVEYPFLNNHDLFVVLDVAVVKNTRIIKKPNDLYDVKVLSSKGYVGWLFLWTRYPFPAKIVEIPKTV